MINTYTYTISQWLKRSKSYINKDLKKSEYNCNFYILDFIKSIIDKDLYKENVIENFSKKIFFNEKMYYYLKKILFDWSEYTFNNDLILEIEKNLKLHIIQ